MAGFWQAFFQKVFHKVTNTYSSKQLALAIPFGVLLGLSPLLSIQALFCVVCATVFRINFVIFIFAGLIFSVVSYVLYPIINVIGEYLLTYDPFIPLFTALYQFNFFKLLQWHHTYTFGAFVTSLIFFIPFYLFHLFFIIIL